MKQHKSAFSLVELLTVIAVIAILASLLLPTLGRARQKCQGAQCISNQHQLSMAWRMYSDDNSDQLLYAQQEYGWVPGTQSYSWLPCYGDDYVQFVSAPNRWNPDVTVKRSVMWPYCSKSLDVWKCPAIHLTVSTNGFGSSKERRPVAWGHGVNSFMGGGNDGQPVYRKLSTVPAPSSLFVFTDFREDQGVWGTSVRIGGRDGFGEWPAFAHGGSASYTFVDGHSEAHKWHDPRTTPAYDHSDNMVSPGNSDAAWIVEHAFSLN